jgi:hypothetical protein
LYTDRNFVPPTPDSHPCLTPDREHRGPTAYSDH